MDEHERSRRPGTDYRFARVAQARSANERRLLIVSMKGVSLSIGGVGWAGGVVAGCGLERRSCLYCLLGGRTGRDGRPAAWAQVQKGRQAARRRAAPPAAVGEKGLLVVSMCQTASVSRRAISI